MFVDIFIRRPILASVCSLIIILAGAVSIPTLPISYYPELAPPQVTVNAFYTGASAQVVESAVTTPLEQVINGAEGMVYLQSTSGNDGTSQITATFDINRSIDLAAVDIQNRISQAEGRLPNEVKSVGISVNKSSAGFVFGAGVYAEHGEYDSLFMSNYVDVFVRDALKRVPGVADVIIFGERKYSMRLWVDPDRLAGRGLTAGDVANALREQNVQVAAGQVGQPPSRTGQQFQISVRAVGRLVEPSEFDNIILKRGDDGSLVRLRDVGHSELGAETYAADLRFDGLDAVGIGVTQLPTANTLDVYQRCNAELERLAKSFPPGLKIRVAFDNVSVVSESIREVVQTLLEAIALVILVMFLFLQDWRSTIIPTIAIPVSLIGTFAFVKLFGFSINTLTLFGITLATGLVVDDAIVVIENIHRHIHDYNKTPRDAASSAMGEVVGPVIATGLVLATVFVPVALFPGTTGRLYQQFALTIAFSMALSTFNSLTLTPAISALILRKEQEKGRFFRGVNYLIDTFSHWYVVSLRRLISLRFLVLLAFVGALALTAWTYRAVPTGFVPEEDQGYFIVLVQGPDGASLEYTRDVVKQAETAMRAVPEVSTVFAVTGFSFVGSAPNRGILFAGLKPYHDRPGEEHSAAAAVQRLFPQLMGIQGAIVVPFLPPPIQGLSNFGGFQFQAMDTTGGDISRFAGVVQQIVGQGNQTPGLTGLFTAFTVSDPQLVVTIDREKAKSIGVPLNNITDTLQILMGSAYINDFDFNNRAYRVYVQADQKFRGQPDDIGRYYARAANNSMVRLDNVVKVSESTSPPVISHYNLFRSAEIDGSNAPGTSSGEALNKMEDLARRVMPPGMTFEWTGQSREEILAGGQAGLIFGLGILLVYLTLAALYESISLPFIILLSVPLAVFGALLGVMLRGLVNDVYCQIGLVMLIGLSAKNGILIVEFAEQLRDRGLSVADAAIEAARIRLRPILMTSFAFILGVLPLVFATGAGRAARHSVGTAVCFGMLVSTFLNLIFIPVLYVVLKNLTGGRTRAAVPAGAETGGADV
jgi:hydrophobic/amphiphilic exporter-1 (mainly G- bacteria), HAE1 family